MGLKKVDVWTCDRCKRSTTDGDGPYEPINWGYVNKYLLCPECMKRYETVFRAFINESAKPKAKKRGQGVKNRSNSILVQQ